MELATVGVDVRIGDGAIINAHTTVGHDVQLDVFAHLSVGMHLAGRVQVGVRAWLQAGCSADYRVGEAERGGITIWNGSNWMKVV